MRNVIAMSCEQSFVKQRIVRSRAWMSVAIIAPFTVAAALSAPRISQNSALDLALGVAGWLCFSAGALFRWWATLYIGGRKHQELVVDGPYSICRNPLYLGSFLLAFSIAFFLHSVTFAIGLLIALPIYLGITVPWEEAKLQDIYGDAFASYRERVPKFIPRFALFESPSTVCVKLTGLVRELRSSARWIWIPLLAEAVAHLRTEAWWPTVLQLP